MADKVKHRAALAEGQIRDQEPTVQDLEEMQRQLRDATESLWRAQEAMIELQEALEMSEVKSETLIEELTAKEDELRGLTETAVREREARELEHYRTVESVRGQVGGVGTMRDISIR